MNKIVAAFKANQTLKTATAVIRHADKAPMTACIFSQEIAEAWAFVNSAINHALAD